MKRTDAWRVRHREWQDRDIYLHELDGSIRPSSNAGSAQASCRNSSGGQTKDASTSISPTFRDPPWNAPFYRKLGFVDVHARTICRG